jgi:hypothetical protein
MWKMEGIVGEMRTTEADWLGVFARAERERAVDSDEAGWVREVVVFPNLETELGGVAGEGGRMYKARLVGAKSGL